MIAEKARDTRGLFLFPFFCPMVCDGEKEAGGGPRHFLVVKHHRVAPPAALRGFL